MGFPINVLGNFIPMKIVNQLRSKNIYNGRVDVAFDLAVAFDLVVAFDFLQFPCVDAVCAVRKMEKEMPVFEV
ncbi:MAG: hypothetical protein HY254_19395 [Burkholderiales bacterium]|nr:hypothetical protein [Burkholderiales bacterium]